MPVQLNNDMRHHKNITRCNAKLQIKGFCGSLDNTSLTLVEHHCLNVQWNCSKSFHRVWFFIKSIQWIAFQFVRSLIGILRLPWYLLQIGTSCSVIERISVLTVAFHIKAEVGLTGYCYEQVNMFCWKRYTQLLSDTSKCVLLNSLVSKYTLLIAAAAMAPGIQYFMLWVHVTRLRRKQVSKL